MSLHCIYKHTFPDGKVYIGQTLSGNTKKRWHDGGGYKGQRKVMKAIVKYGWDNITHEVIADNIPSDQIDVLEQAYIAKYDSIENGYNTAAGGAGWHPHKEKQQKASLLVMHVLRDNGYCDVVSWWVDKFSDVFMENMPTDDMINTFNILFEFFDREVVRFVTGHSFQDHHFKDTLGKYVGQMFLQNVNVLVEIYPSIAEADEEEAKEALKSFLCQARGQFAHITHCAYGVPIPDGNTEVVMEAVRAHVENVWRQINEHLSETG